MKLFALLIGLLILTIILIYVFIEKILKYYSILFTFYSHKYEIKFVSNDLQQLLIKK